MNKNTPCPGQCSMEITSGRSCVPGTCDKVTFEKLRAFSKDYDIVVCAPRTIPREEPTNRVFTDEMIAKCFGPWSAELLDKSEAMLMSVFGPFDDSKKPKEYLSVHRNKMRQALSLPDELKFKVVKFSDAIVDL